MRTRLDFIMSEVLQLINDKITCTIKGFVCLLHCLLPLMRTLKSVTTSSRLGKLLGFGQRLLSKTNRSPKRNSYGCRNSGTFFSSGRSRGEGQDLWLKVGRLNGLSSLKIFHFIQNNLGAKGRLHPPLGSFSLRWTPPPRCALGERSK